MIFNNSKFISWFSLFSFSFVSFIGYRKLCSYYTFKTIDNLFKKKLLWEHDLDIYSVSMPRFFSSSYKKKKCVLLIGGYKDIPYLWNELEKFFVLDSIDFYAPRTFGNGRSFFQIVDWKDWVITYLEAIYLLQELYESVDIIGFSTGSVIALYISQFSFKCKINNLFLVSPFLLANKSFSMQLFFNDNLFSRLLNLICRYTFRFHFKSTNKFAGYRSTYNTYYSLFDYFELFGDLEMESSLFEFIKFRPSQLLVDNVVMFYPNDDTIIGNIFTQHQIVSGVFSSRPVDLVSIPSYPPHVYTSPNLLPSLSGHVIFKENPAIIENFYYHLKKYL